MISPAIRYMLLAVFFFSLMNLSVKLAGDIPPIQVVFLRSAVSIVIAWYMVRKARLNPIGNNISYLLLRGLFGSGGLMLFFITVQQMPLASALTIQYLSPVFVAILGMFLLKEKIKPIQWLFFVLAFAGVIMIKGFDSRISVLMLLTGIASAVFSAMAYNMIRLMRDSDHPLIVVLYFPLVSLLISAPLLLLGWTWPTFIQWVWLILVGIFAQLGQIFMTRAFHMEKATLIGSLNYLGVVFGLGFGYFIFDEHYGFWAILGMLLVVAGVVFNIFSGQGKQKEGSPLISRS